MRSALELGRKLVRHHREVLLLVKRLTEELAQLRVNRLRVVVTQEAKAGVDLLLEEDAIGFREARQHLDEKRQKIRTLRHAAWLAQRTPHPAPALPLHPIGERRHALHGAIDLIG